MAETEIDPGVDEIVELKGGIGKKIYQELAGERRMTKTALDLTPEDRQMYQPAAAIRDRKTRSDDQVEKRWKQAHRVAEEAAKLLRDEFGAEKVLLFGSLAHRSWFTAWSDIDLAVWGLSPDRYFAAVAAVTGLSSDFQIDLIDPESCSRTLRSVIERDGVEL